MSERRAQFPAQVWDGTAADRNSRQIDAGPAFPSYDQVVAELIATQEYTRGLVSGLTDPYDAEAGANISKGMAVYIDLTGRLQKAVNNLLAGFQVAGIMYEDVSTGFSGRYLTDGPLSMVDWTAVIGTASLTRGSIYYLDSTAGKLTTTAPTADGYYVVPVGRAQTDQILDIEIGPAVRL